MNTEIELFISYSTKNNNIAHRVYYDLVRSGIKAWLYEIDGELGVSFRKEIFERLNTVKYCCLIDSKHARNSIYVNEECDYFCNLMNTNDGKNRKFIICQIEKIDEWRNKEIFKGQNDIRYIDFFNYGEFDSKKKLDSLDYRERYRHGMEQLFKVLGIQFLPWSNLPMWRDYEKEITAFSLDLENRKILIGDYKNFLRRYKANSENSESRIKIIIDDCDKLGIKLISNYLALGAILVDGNKKTEANLTFKNITLNFSDDPRGWAALGASEFYLGRYSSALDCFNRASDIIQITIDNPYNQKHYGEIVHNKIRVLIALNQLSEAKAIMDNLESRYRDLPEIKIVAINLLIKEDNIRIAEKLYSSISNQIYVDDELNFYDLQDAAGELERNLGEYYSMKGMTTRAIYHFKMAHKLAPSEIRYVAELSLLLHCSKETQKGRDLVIEGLKLIPEKDTDYYFYGLLLFLNGNKKEAEYNYFKSKMNWSYYVNLIKCI